MLRSLFDALETKRGVTDLLGRAERADGQQQRSGQAEPVEGEAAEHGLGEEGERR